MDNILTAFIIMILILSGSLTLFDAFLAAHESLRSSWVEVEERLADQANTQVSLISAEAKSAGTYVDVTLENSGQMRLMEFDRWDLIVQHYNTLGDYEIDRYTYTSGSAGAGEWTIVGIYSNASTLTSETFEPNIFNPQEELILRFYPPTAVGVGTTNLSTIVTTNGTTVSAQFSN